MQGNCQMRGQLWRSRQYAAPANWQGRTRSGCALGGVGDAVGAVQESRRAGIALLESISGEGSGRIAAAAGAGRTGVALPRGEGRGAAGGDSPGYGNAISE